MTGEPAKLGRQTRNTSGPMTAPQGDCLDHLGQHGRAA